MNKEEISKMTKEEQIRQLEWSDQHEFSYWYAYYLLDYINQLETNRDELKKHIQGLIYDIEPKGTRINYNCEYDSEDDYIYAMKEQSRLETLKAVNLIIEIPERNKE